MKAEGLKLLKPETKPEPKRPRCEHVFTYEHTIYSLGDNEGIAVHRQCRKCGVHEVCKVPSPNWTRSVKGFSLPDLRK